MLPLVVITGPTASGKSSLAVKIAQKYNGEIISADSRAIYLGADIATAKPTIKERQSVPHWGIDLVKPGQYFSVADYKDYAQQKISEIRGRGHLPILVGGTGLYVDAVLFDYQFGPKAKKWLRFKLQHMNIAKLQAYCQRHNITLPENSKNKRYLIRAIESGGDRGTKQSQPLSASIIVGIATEKDILRGRIEKRMSEVISAGAIDEARVLGKKYGWKNEAMRSNLYPLIRLYLKRRLTFEELVAKSIVLDYRLAKRQITWMRRNKFIHWLSLSDAEKFIVDQLEKTE